jgi:peptidoglycan hydrolase-like protein with peptidoglycan-binding domain
MLAAVDQLFAQDMIQLAQTQLKMAGFHLGRTDGIFDMLTADPVRKYQVANGIPVCGLLDEPSIHIPFPGFQDARFTGRSRARSWRPKGRVVQPSRLSPW